MGNLDDINNMYDVLEEKFPPLTLVVNNAGISDEVYFIDATPADFERMTNVDWRGVYFSSQRAARQMIARGIKRLIINLASDGAAYMTGCTLTMDGGATLPVVAANDFV